jgi:hypothetical protein
VAGDDHADDAFLGGVEEGTAAEACRDSGAVAVVDLAPAVVLMPGQPAPCPETAVTAVGKAVGVTRTVDSDRRGGIQQGQGAGGFARGLERQHGDVVRLSLPRLRAWRQPGDDAGGGGRPRRIGRAGAPGQIEEDPCLGLVAGVGVAAERFVDHVGAGEDMAVGDQEARSDRGRPAGPCGEDAHDAPFGVVRDHRGWPKGLSQNKCRILLVFSPAFCVAATVT